jgi:hypothetical protein
MPNGSDHDYIQELEEELAMFKAKLERANEQLRRDIDKQAEQPNELRLIKATICQIHYPYATTTEQACPYCRLGSLAEQIKAKDAELKRLEHGWRSCQAERLGMDRIIDKQAEQLKAKDRLLQRMGEYTAQRLSKDELIRLLQQAIEQALKGGE